MVRIWLSDPQGPVGPLQVAIPSEYPPEVYTPAENRTK